jgi:hypothetical protein
MPKMRTTQLGMGISSIMSIIVVVGFIIMVIFKLGPSYMTYMTLKSIMNGMAEAPEPVQGGKPVLIRALENRMMVNEVRSVDTKAFTVKKSGENTMDLTLAYEQRIHLLANIDVVLTFDHTVVVKGR